MIQDITVKKIIANHDDRGYFAEILKFGEDTFHDIKQVSYSETRPGVIKAFHWHKRQWDVWFISKGMGQVVLYDVREHSPTKHTTDVYYAGEKNQLLIAIAPGVAHGYRVLGTTDLGIVYCTSEAYDPKHPDEERIPFNDPAIGFDWQTKNR